MIAIPLGVEPAVRSGSIDGRATAPRTRAAAARWSPARREARAAAALPAGDVLAVTAAVAVVLRALDGGGPRTGLVLAAVLAWPALLWVAGLHGRRPWGLDASSAGTGAAALLLAGVAEWALLSAAGRLGPAALPVGGAAAVAALPVALSGLARAAAGPGLLAVLGPERVALVGDPASLEPLAPVVAARRDAVEVARLDPADPAVADPAPLPGVDHVVLAAALPPAVLSDLARSWAGRAGRVSIAAVTPDAVGALTGVAALRSVALVRIRWPASPAARAAKRAADLVVAGAAAVVLAPLLAAAALAVRLETPGPALFRQARVGRGGRPFTMAKFRTMVVDAEARRAALLAASRDPDWLHVDDDPRITRVGRWLRRTSLDELPQLWNVLRGDMSLVGPRPLVPEEHARTPAWARTRSDVAPGVTGLWQVSGRTGLSFQDMLALDRLYALTWSPRRDLLILLRTAPAVLTGRGAN